jgi:hypothetical protein
VWEPGSKFEGGHDIQMNNSYILNLYLFKSLGDHEQLFKMG